MKTKLFSIISFCLFLFAVFSCDKEKDKDQESKFVTKIDIENLAGKYLPDFYLFRERYNGATGKDYTFKRDIDTAYVRITTGLYPSAENADTVLRNYLSMLCAYFFEGPQYGSPVGDKYRYVGPDMMHPVAMAFIRKNALFIMSGDEKYSDILSLAEKIDHDIINDADFVSLGNSLSQPVIDSITGTKPVLKNGETCKITIHASDPDNESLDYYGFGIGSYEPDPENVFTANASIDFIGEPFYGSHVYNFIVINESNVLSERATFEIIISEEAKK